MQADTIETLRNQIDMAHRLASSGRAETGVHLFAAARDYASQEVDQTKLKAEIVRQIGLHHKEREQYRKDIARLWTGADNSRPLVLISDSLGLPRPMAMDSPRKGAEHIYANLLGSKGRKVDPICQRFFTSGDAVALLRDNPNLGRDSDVVIHLGLNDAARRMFLERQRIALLLVPEEVREKIVGFAQKYRRQILRFLPPLHYTSPAAFTANLELICAMLKQRHAHRIALTTIILPPPQLWPGSPRMALFFGQYNQEILAAAYRHDILLFDFDRHVWANLHLKPLETDGMHLSAFGHRLFCQELQALMP